MFSATSQGKRKEGEYKGGVLRRVFQRTGMGCTHLGVLCPLELLGAPPSPALYTGYKLPLSQCSGWSRRHPRWIQSQRESRGGFPTRMLTVGGSLVCVPPHLPKAPARGVAWGEVEFLLATLVSLITVSVWMDSGLRLGMLLGTSAGSIHEHKANRKSTRSVKKHLWKRRNQTQD